MSELRIGHGYDVHRLVEGRPLIIGGVDVPHTLGLLGHSDADVLIHAIMDAIIGALGLGDIGKHFPDTSEEFLGISSVNLLIRVRTMLNERGARLVNLDSTVIIQRPKLRPYIDKMRDNIAFALGVEADRVNVKATTEERLGFTGAEDGAAAHAVAIIEIN